MVALARGFSARGVDVVTFDFPYIRRQRRVPDRAPVLEEAFREVVEAARTWKPGSALFIGGKSMGGRMATHLGAAGPESLTGIAAFGYPLHPPGKPERLRTGHLPSIAVPVLIVQGERDAFGTPGELRPVIASMPAPVRLHSVLGGDHSLTVRGRARDDVLREALDAACLWMREQT
jgi:hypothetical protein